MRLPPGVVMMKVEWPSQVIESEDMPGSIMKLIAASRAASLA